MMDPQATLLKVLAKAMLEKSVSFERCLLKWAEVVAQLNATVRECKDDGSGAKHKAWQAWLEALSQCDRKTLVVKYDENEGELKDLLAEDTPDLGWGSSLGIGEVPLGLPLGATRVSLGCPSDAPQVSLGCP